MVSRLNERRFAVGKLKISYADIAAAALFIAFAAFFFHNARFGSNEADETLYQVVCYRLSRGDKLFADDWMFITSAFFQYIPYKIACMICGGTEGIILVLRYFYVAVKMIFFVYIYLSLRSYGFWAVLCSALYCCTDLFGMKTTDFLSVCMNAALITAMILFIRKDARPARYVFAGFVFSCAVIVQPGTALVWAFYCALVLIAVILNKKGKPFLTEYGFVLSVKTWKYLLFGVLGAAALFFISCAVFFTGTDLRAIALGFEELTKLLGRRTAAGYSFWWIRINKPVMYAQMYNPLLTAAFIALLILSLVLVKYKRKLEKPIFIALFAVFAAMSVHLMLYPVESTGNTVGEACSHPLLLALMGIPFYAFTENKNRRLFGFLLFSVVLSLTVDIFSNNTFGSVLLVGDVPAVLLFRDYLLEKINTGGGKSKKTDYKKAYAAALCSFLAFIAVFEVFHVVYMTGLPEMEAHFSGSFQPLDTEVSQGVYKGTVTTRELADFCEKTARDAERIRGICKEGLYVADYDVTAYLGADSDVCSPWAQVFMNWEGEETWWRAHKWPDTVYIPYSALSYSEDVAPADEKLEYFRTKGSFEIEEGECGYILMNFSPYPDA